MPKVFGIALASEGGVIRVYHSSTGAHDFFIQDWNNMYTMDTGGLWRAIPNTFGIERITH